MKRVCIAISDPNQLFREGLQHLLRRSRFTVSIVAKTLAETLNVTHESPGLDLIICGLDSQCDVEAQIAKLDRRKLQGSGTRSVILAHAPDRNLLCRAMEAGVDAVLSKDISGEVLQLSLELVMLGQQVFPALAVGAASASVSDLNSHSRTCAMPVISPTLEAKAPPSRLIYTAVDQSFDVVLSEREAQVLQCLINGSSNKLIARDLSITEATVKVHIKGLLRKVRANNRTQAAIWGMNNGMTVGCRPALVAGLQVDTILRRASWSS